MAPAIASCSGGDISMAQHNNWWWHLQQKDTRVVIIRMQQLMGSSGSSSSSTCSHMCISTVCTDSDCYSNLNYILEFTINGWWWQQWHEAAKNQHWLIVLSLGWLISSNKRLTLWCFTIIHHIYMLSGATTWQYLVVGVEPGPLVWDWPPDLNLWPPRSQPCLLCWPPQLGIHHLTYWGNWTPFPSTCPTDLGTCARLLKSSL